MCPDPDRVFQAGEELIVISGGKNSYRPTTDKKGNLTPLRWPPMTRGVNKSLPSPVGRQRKKCVGGGAGAALLRGTRALRYCYCYARHDCAPPLYYDCYSCTRVLVLRLLLLYYARVLLLLLLPCCYSPATTPH